MIYGATIRATAPEQVDLRQAAGPVAVAGLAVIATIHGLDVSGKLDETFYLGVMFILGPIMSALVSAGLLMSRHVWLGWALAGLVSAGAFAGYCLSRTTGLPSASRTSATGPNPPASSA